MNAQPLTADERRRRVFDFLDARGIRYEWYEHPEAPTSKSPSNSGCIRANCRSRRPSGWNAGWGCAPDRYRHSG